MSVYKLKYTYIFELKINVENDIYTQIYSKFRLCIFPNKVQPKQNKKKCRDQLKILTLIQSPVFHIWCFTACH